MLNSWSSDSDFYKTWNHSYKLINQPGNYIEVDYNKNLKNFRKQIYAAINPFKLQFILKDKDDVYADTLRRYPALEYAIILNDEETLKYLLNLKPCSKYFSDSLLFLYIDSLVEDNPPNLEILKLLLSHVQDINQKFYDELQEGQTNALDFAIFHMACFKKLHLPVLEELFLNGARSSAIGAYSAFQQLKNYKAGLNSTTLSLSKYVTPSEKAKIRFEELFPNNRIHFHGNRISFHALPRHQTFFHHLKGRFRFGKNILPKKYSLDTESIGYYTKNSGLKNLYQYNVLEAKHSPNTQTYLTTKEFKQHLEEIEFLMRCISKIYLLCKGHNFPPLQESCLNIFRKKFHSRPLSIWLIDKEKEYVKPVKIFFLEIMFGTTMAEEPVFVCNIKNNCSSLLLGTLTLLFKTLNKHLIYFNELVKNGKFEKCFDQMKIKNITEILSEFIKKIPVEKNYSKVIQDIRHQHLNINFNKLTL